MLCVLLAMIPLVLLIPTVLAVRSMRVHRAKVAWWVVWWLLALTGTGLGVYCTTGIEYMYDPKLRVTGFAVPIVMFELHDGRWVDFVNDFGPLVFVINAFLFDCVLLLPLSIVALFRFGLWPRSDWRDMSERMA
jgi:hypothetical protein